MSSSLWLNIPCQTLHPLLWSHKCPPYLLENSLTAEVCQNEFLWFLIKPPKLRPCLIDGHLNRDFWFWPFYKHHFLSFWSFSRRLPEIGEHSPEKKKEMKDAHKQISSGASFGQGSMSRDLGSLCLWGSAGWLYPTGKCGLSQSAHWRLNQLSIQTEFGWKPPLKCTDMFNISISSHNAAVPSTPISLLFSCYVLSNSLQPHELQHARLPCPSLCPWVCSDSCPLNQWCHTTISSSLSPSPPALNLSQHQDLFQWDGF